MEGEDLPYLVKRLVEQIAVIKPKEPGLVGKN
jgi:hypothetical protein